MENQDDDFCAKAIDDCTVELIPPPDHPKFQLGPNGSIKGVRKISQFYFKRNFLNMELIYFRLKVVLLMFSTMLLHRRMSLIALHFR